MKIFLCIVIIIILLAANTVSAKEAVEHELVKQGFDYINEAHYRDAISVFKKALESNPENAEAYYGLGISYLRIGDTEIITIPRLVQEAIYSFKKALNFNAKHPEIYYFLGLCYLALKDEELAVKQYDILEGLNRDLADQFLDKIVAYERRREDSSAQEKFIPFEEKN